jgi:hypothetical protein
MLKGSHPIRQRLGSFTAEIAEDLVNHKDSKEYEGKTPFTA